MPRCARLGTCASPHVCACLCGGLGSTEPPGKFAFMTGAAESHGGATRKGATWVRPTHTNCCSPTDSASVPTQVLWACRQYSTWLRVVEDSRDSECLRTTFKLLRSVRSATMPCALFVGTALGQEGLRWQQAGHRASEAPVPFPAYQLGCCGCCNAQRCWVAATFSDAGLLQRSAMRNMGSQGVCSLARPRQ